MIFPSEKKKELWRYASRNNPAMSDGLPIQSPQPLHPQHRLHPQRMGEQRLSIGSRGSCNDESLRLAQTSTPPPPYNCIDCSGSYSQNSNHRQRHQHHQHQPQHHHNRLDGVLAETQTDIYADFLPTEDSDSDYAMRAVNTYTKGGASGCESSNDDSLNERRSVRSQQEPPRMEPPTPPTNLQSTQTNNRFFPIATSAANMFRNCCGGSHANESSSSNGHHPGIPSTSHNPNPQQHQSQTAANPRHSIPLTSATRKRKDFDAFIKQLKHKQPADLLRAVKSRVDLPAKTNSSITGGGNVVVPSASPSYLKCILIKCTTIATEEDLHHVTACRLFFWPDLRNGAELKRLPLCPTAGDSVYACCNPLHWFRILHLIDAESEPPPYHRSKMLRLRDADSEEDFPNVEKSIIPTWMAPRPNSGRSSSSISSIIKQTTQTTTTESQLFGPSLESFTTDGKDRTAYSKGWCQIAYWELAQRVGEFFYAKEPAVNIFTEGPDDFGGDSMCLLDLKASKVGKAKSSDAVQNTRQKVGLGVTLSLECDDVWIYNRGNVPIFVDSPTLAEDMDRVCKVMPGYCLKAFQMHRAQSLAGRQTHHPHLGPIDQFSMKISFAKGWGYTYRRQDIMGCPCWLEVHFTCLR